ncbi:hypothetical protein R6Z07M_015391 [Ovis aries]
MHTWARVERGCAGVSPTGPPWRIVTVQGAQLSEPGASASPGVDEVRVEPRAPCGEGRSKCLSLLFRDDFLKSMRVVSSEMAPVFLALILADISRELPRPFQTSPSHPPSPCRLAYGLNPGPERRQQPVRTSSVRPLGFLSRGPPTWGQLTPEPPPSGKGRTRPEPHGHRVGVPVPRPPPSRPGSPSPGGFRVTGVRRTGKLRKAALPGASSEGPSELVPSGRRAPPQAGEAAGTVLRRRPGREVPLSLGARQAARPAFQAPSARPRSPAPAHTAGTQ